MAWYALDALDDARDATTSLLLPVDRGRWVRLAIIALFVGIGGGAPVNSGGGGNVSSTGGGGGLPTDGAPPTDLPSAFPSPESILALVLALVVLLFVVAILWGAVASVMEFVLVTGLRDREVEIRRPFRANLWRGLRLFGFRIALLVVGALLVVVPIVLLVALGISVSPFVLLLLVPGLFLVFAVALVGSVVSQLTTDFVVPTMLTEDRGVVDAWRRLWPTVRAEWQQFALYVLVRFGLGIAAGLAVGLVTALAALVVALPFALVGGALFLGVTAVGGGSIGAVGWALVALLVFLFVLVVVAVSLVIQVPAVTFLRYYALVVLGFADADLDLVGVERGGSEDEDGSEGEDEDGADSGAEADADDGEDGEEDESTDRPS